tara:strand:+ start:3076 stop:3228 length:153 start_codon:yes stop_codon:yes gene_type:complete
MKIEISKERLKEIIQEELRKKVGEEGKKDPEFVKYIVESLTRSTKNGGSK